MPAQSEWRNALLHSTEEVAAAWGRPERSVRRLQGVEGVYSEKIEGSGGQKRLYFDARTVAEVWGQPTGPLPQLEPAPSTALELAPAALQAAPAEEGPGPLAERRLVPDLRQADPDDLALWQRLEALRARIADAPRGSKVGLVRRFAEAEGTTPTTVYRWLATPAADFLKARRADAGESHVPPHLLEAATSLWLHHPRASAWTIHRWLEVADPDILIYRRGGYRRRFSVRGVRDVRRRLEQDPVSRAALMDEDARREFIRTWSGAVVTTHPNEQWQMDMTRCDVFVFGFARPGDTAPTAFRLRVHAIIDHFTGAVPALLFSREESTRPTTRLLILAMFPKPGGWQVYGLPRRMYHDNGSAYIAETTRRGLETLGVQVSTSQAWVSHTRGKVENFHKLFHAWERSEGGYAGQDASERNDWELARRTRNTLAWWEKGCPPEADPGREHRLPLEEEYKREALNWLQNDYHARPLAHGLTRAEAFARLVPQDTLRQHDLHDLFQIFAKSETRTVTGNGCVRYNNFFYTLPDGSLMPYQGRQVVVTEYEHPLTGEPVVGLWLEQPNGTLLELGVAVEAPSDALSPEAFAQRKASKQAVRQLFAEAEQYRETYMNPAWRQDAILAKGGPAEPVTVELRGPRAELRRETPAEAARKQAESQAQLIETMRQSASPISRALASLGKGTTAPDPFDEEAV